MPEVKVPIICGDKIGEGNDYYDAIPVNLVAVMRDIEGSTGYLHSHDGLSLVFGGASGVSRGALYNERMGRSFRLNGTRLLEIAQGGDDVTFSLIGEVPGVSQASMPYSFNSFLVVANGYVFRYDGVTFSQITDPDIGQPIDGAWIDGYYVFIDDEYIYHTDINDETSIDPLKFATAEISPDKNKAVGRTQDDLLVVFGRYTIEYFVNQANEQFAFTRINQKALSVGIIGTKCWTEMGGQLYILGGRKEEQPSVHAIGTGQAIRLATRTIDLIINKYTEAELSLAKVESRTIDGNQLLYIFLTNDTLVFNNTVAQKLGINSAWSRLESDGGRWRGINIIYDPILNSWSCGDVNDGEVYRLDRDTAAQFGSEYVDSYFYTPFVPAESMSIDELEINTVGGFSSETTSMFVSTTRDGAAYSTEYSQELAIPLNYDKRFIVRRLAYVRKKVGFKFRVKHRDKLNVSGLIVRGS